MLKVVRFYFSAIGERINMKKIFIVLSLMILSGCSLKSKDPNSVNLRFYFESSTQKKLFSFLHGVDYALDSVSQSSCLGVNVVGTGIDSTYDKSMIGTALEQLNKGEACTYRGVTSPPIAVNADATFELSVPAGTRRFIQVLGFQDPNQAICGKSQPFGEIYLPSPGENVTGYELGREVRDLFTSQTISISNRYDALSAAEKERRNISCNSSSSGGGGAVGGGGASGNGITAASFTYLMNPAGAVDCGESATAILGSVDCAGFPLQTSCSSRYSSSCDTAIIGNPARYWYGTCDGGPATVYAVCVSSTQPAGFSTQAYNASGIADCQSDQSALFSNWYCGNSNSRGSESCPSISDGTCQTSISQYWKNSCSTLGGAASAGGLTGWATCIQNSGSPINKVDFTVVSAPFTAIDSTPTCADGYKAIAGQLSCGGGMEMQTSCPLDTSANNLSCASSASNWGSSWYFKCSAAAPGGSTHQYTLLCLPN